MKLLITFVIFTFVSADVSELNGEDGNLSQHGYEYKIPSDNANLKRISSTEKNFVYQTEVNTVEEASTEPLPLVTLSNENKIPNSDFININIQSPPQSLPPDQSFYLPPNKDYNSEPLSKDPYQTLSQSNRPAELYDMESFNSPFIEFSEDKNSYKIQIQSNPSYTENMQKQIHIRPLSSANNKPIKIQSNKSSGGPLESEQVQLFNYPIEEISNMEREVIEPTHGEIYDSVSNILFQPPPPNMIIVSSEVASPTPVQKLLLQKIQLYDGTNELSYVVSDANPLYSNRAILSTQNHPTSSYEYITTYDCLPQQLNLVLIPSAKEREILHYVNNINSQFPTYFQTSNPNYQKLNSFANGRSNYNTPSSPQFPETSYSSDPNILLTEQQNHNSNLNSYQVEPR